MLNYVIVLRSHELQLITIEIGCMNEGKTENREDRQIS